MSETTEPTPPDTQKTPTKKLAPEPYTVRWFVENILSLSFAVFIVLMLRSSVIEAFKIPSGSMIPTLFVGDHIFVNKFAYGFKLPFSDYFSDEAITLIEREPPKRGDIIVFLYPQNREIYYIKRVVGVPGDRIDVRDKEVFINDMKVEREPLSEAESKAITDEFDDPQYLQAGVKLHREKLRRAQPGATDPQDPGHLMMVSSFPNYAADQVGTIEVPANHLFVMGDNRDFSNDSRMWGFVPYELVKGKALVIWLSAWIDKDKWDFLFHPERMGTILK